MKKSSPAFVISLLLVASICLSVLNYYISFLINITLSPEEFSLTSFMLGIILLIFIESFVITLWTKNKLYGIISTTTIPLWTLATLTSLSGISGSFLNDVIYVFGLVELNLIFLIFSILGALIGINFTKPHAKKKLSRK